MNMWRRPRRVKRARARLEVEMTANAEKGSDEPQAIIPLLTVSKGLSQLRELEDARDAELHMQAQAIEEQRKEEADEKKRKLAQEPKSLPLEKLALQALRKKAAQTMTDLSLRLATTLALATLIEERRKIVECEGDDLKSEMEEKLAIVQHALTKLDESTCEYERTWDEKAEEATADEMADIRSDLEGENQCNGWQVASMDSAALADSVAASMRGKLSFHGWASALPSLASPSRTPFKAASFKSPLCRGPPGSSSATFILPFLFLGLFSGSGPRLSKRVVPMQAHALHCCRPFPAWWPSLVLL